ncbi:nucleoside deoxyribosyltransferase [Halorubrum tailed virus 29]|uniref:Nucleoside deoxyribosyltransferase n=1 Tax=Halorubrum tailed virus 29 TaxID=2878010 RepID=A0AAE8Y0R5_9CAUD|nr:nucleoside deoxyribosyltransferase [Halorubrum tailed virus 29]UBF23329.1 nucleoside deoxyribosyltransferase [Halorubrum tailed virus 29]
MSDADLSVYLAGPVQHKADGGAAWRDAIQETYSDIRWLDPLAKYNVPVEGIDIVPEGSDAAGRDGAVTPADIVNGDKSLLRDADVVLVGYSAVRSIGTPMEVMWSHDHHKPVVIWVRDGTEVSELSPWYRYHADAIHHSLSDAVNTLLKLN